MCMDKRGKPPGPARKPDDHSTRRGATMQLERVLLRRIDQVRGTTARAAWIRQVIEQRLHQLAVQRDQVAHQAARRQRKQDIDRLAASIAVVAQQARQIRVETAALVRRRRLKPAGVL